MTVRRAHQAQRTLGVRREWADKAALLAGGGEVEALAYSRASQDKKKQGKSVTDQDRLNRTEMDRYGWRAGASFSDNDRSASRHARKEREDYQRLIEMIESGRGDVLVMWELARGQRDLAVYVAIRDLCMRVGLYFWHLGGTLYDLRLRPDRLSLGFQAVQSEDQADYIRENVQRGIDGAAIAGRPHGHITYGYRRVYDQHTRAFLAQEPDTRPREAVSADASDGSVREFSPVGIVTEIFTRIGAGVPLITIERDLNARGIPAPQGGPWRRGVIRKMAMNPAYIGKRVLRGEIVGDGVWDGLVSDELFWAVNRLLSEPDRKTTRPGRVKWLLSYLARCGVCDGPLKVQTIRRGSGANGGRGTGVRGPGRLMYVCFNQRCTAMTVESLDSYVQANLVAWCSRGDVYELLRVAGAADDEQAATARAEATRLRVELEDVRREAEAGNLSAVLAGRMEKGLLERIEAAEQAAANAAVPAVLRDLIGPDAAAKWDAVTDVAAKREAIRAVMDPIRLHPVNHPVNHRDNDSGTSTKGRRRSLDERVELGGLFATTATRPQPDP